MFGVRSPICGPDELPMLAGGVCGCICNTQCEHWPKYFGLLSFNRVLSAMIFVAQNTAVISKQSGSIPTDL